MPQVVTNENFVELVQTGKVQEFKAPEAPVDAKPGDTTNPPKVDGKAEEAKPDQTVDKPGADKPRGEDGKFVKADDPKTEVKTEVKVEPAEDDDTSKLSDEVRRKIDRIVGKKHRAMKEAEEFGRDEYRARAEAERRADALQQQIDALKGTKSEGAQPGEGEDPNEPKQGDFKTVGEYSRALIKYEAKKAGEAGRHQAEQSRQQEQANAVIGTFVERQEAFKKATPDYEQVVGDSDLVVPNIVQQYLIESEVGPQLAYHFAKNPEEVARLKKLSPARQVAEVGKLEIKFEKKAEPNKVEATREVSRAPAPIQTLEAKSTTVTKDPKDMSFSELRAHRMAERAAKGR